MNSASNLTFTTDAWRIGTASLNSLPSPCRHTAAADRDRLRLRDPRRRQLPLRAATALQAATAHVVQDVHRVPAVSIAGRTVRDLQLREPRPKRNAGGERLPPGPTCGGVLRDTVHDADDAASAWLYGH